MGTEGFAAPEQYEGKVNSSSDLYALGKQLQALAGKNWLSVLWKVPGFALFLYKCTGLRGKDDLKMRHRQEKCFWYRKKKRACQKKCSGGDWNYGDFAGCRCISCRIRAAGSFRKCIGRSNERILRDRGK